MKLFLFWICKDRYFIAKSGIFAKFAPMISLDQLLESRDKRALYQRQILEEFPEGSLVCLTVQLPGSVKRDSRSLLVGGAGLAALLNRFGGLVSYAEVKDLETGYEAYVMVALQPLEAKRACCRLEEEHPLGRLMDMDVVGREGPVSREQVGLPPRQCLLCSQTARYCMRARTHTPEELQEKINHLINIFIP